MMLWCAVEALREEARAGTFDRLARQRPLRLGELVRISAGAFEEIIGRLVVLRDQDRTAVAWKEWLLTDRNMAGGAPEPGIAALSMPGRIEVRG